MAEKNILAYYKSPEDAEKAEKQLSKLGVIDMNTGRFSRFPQGGINHLTNTATGNIPSISRLTLDADPSSRDAGILLGADIGASGLSDGGQDDITGRDISLTVVVDESKHHQALKIIEQTGGIT
ncbi:hypothetical protein PP175_15415 [Aneurinibacillus sp. Ricciae_BoGa-3]|uniref:hypothetical protein n=1 Tax=Aneurinibacillus sp. Ricciae_BoGa-3 TaxID=3022697 RepID=UPI0023409CCE|nr:hypothetical protein [Aneurinibacillus sp. Ricciae_BoGa-3]WCK52809.1 hypothetical protein PP175_15415 [Aneurinibacillus sp. Ricciae_BoGa-3]